MNVEMKESKKSKFIFGSVLFLYGYPVLLIGTLYLTWFVAWGVLGYQPQPSWDDPKYIGSLVDIPYFMTMILIIGFPAAIVAGIGMTPVYLGTFVQSRKRLILGSLIGIVLLAALWWGAVSFLRFDPWQVSMWYAD